MKLGSILKAAGKGALKEVPFGGLAFDIAEAALGQDIDRDNTTGEGLKERLEELTPEQKSKILSKQLDIDALQVQSRAELKKKMEEPSPMSKGRVFVAKMMGVSICLVSLFMLAVILHGYFVEGIYPSLGLVAFVVGIPSLLLMTYFGMDTKALQSILFEIIGRVAKRKNK